MPHSPHLVARFTLRAVLSLVVWGVPHPARADDTLNRFLARAMTQNPSIVAARARWEAVQAGVPQARALEAPMASVTLWSIPSNFDVSETDEVWYGLSQTFPFPGTRGLKGRAAEQMARALEQEYLAVQRDVRMQVKQAWARLYRVQREITVHLEHQVLLDELSQAALSRYALGQAPQADSLNAQVELSTLHASLMALEQEQQGLRVALNALAGAPDDPLFFGRATIDFQPVRTGVEALEQTALARRPELAAAEREVWQRDAEVAVAKLEGRAPEFTAEAQYWDVREGENRWMVSGRITLPWLARSKYLSQRIQMEALRRAAEARVSALRIETVRRIRELFLEIKTAEDVVPIYQQGIVVQAGEALESARIAYAAGRAEFGMVIEAERRLRDLKLAGEMQIALWADRVAELERLVGIDVH